MAFTTLPRDGSVENAPPHLAPRSKRKRNDDIDFDDQGIQYLPQKTQRTGDGVQQPQTFQSSPRRVARKLRTAPFVQTVPRLQQRRQIAQRTRENDDGYNAKFMATLCFNAHANRRREAGITRHSARDAGLFRAVLGEMFTALKQGEGIVEVGKADIAVNLLAHKDSEAGVCGEQLLAKFDTTYRSIRRQLEELDGLMDTRLEVDENLIVKLHDQILSLHHTFSIANVKFTNIFPYTPLMLFLLPLHSFLTTIEADADHPTRTYYHLGFLSTEVSDMVSWLNVPPAPQLEFSDSLKNQAREAMDEELQRKAGIMLSVERPGEFWRHFWDVVEGREVERSQGGRGEVEKEKEEQNRWIEAELSGREKARKKPEAEERRWKVVERIRKEEEEEGRRRVEAVETEVRRVALEKEREGKNEKRQAAERKQQVIQQQERERQQQAPQQEAAQQQSSQQVQDPTTTSPDATPDQMRAKLLTWKSLLRNLMISSTYGHQPTPADLSRLPDAPTYDESLDRLRWLWSNLETPLRTLDPSQLLGHPNSLLELEAWLCLAQVSLVALKIYGGNANEIVATGWKPAVLKHLQQLLTPYGENLRHTDLLFVAEQVGELVTEAYRSAVKSTMRSVSNSASTQWATDATFGSSGTTQDSPNSSFNSVMNSSQTSLVNSVTTSQPQTQATIKEEVTFAPKNNARPYNALLDPDRTTLDANGLPIPHPGVVGCDKPAQANRGENWDSYCAPGGDCAMGGKSIAIAGPTTEFIPAMGGDTNGGSFKPVCQFFRDSLCMKGGECKFPHVPCAHWVRGTCKYGEGCKDSHDPWFITQADFKGGIEQGGEFSPIAGAGKEGALGGNNKEAVKPACHFYKQGTCYKGEECKFAHAPCRHWMRGTCNYGEGCKGSHDPWFLTQDDSAAGGAEHDAGRSPIDDFVKSNKKAWMANTMCRDGAGCTNRKCGFAHPRVEGTSAGCEGGAEYN